MENKSLDREKVIIKTSIIGIIGNFLLVGFKAAVGLIAGSISIVMDALNNLTDALSSIITIIGTKLSNKKPDKKHPFGHGRVEYITSTIVAALILVAGGLAIYESIISIIDYWTKDKTLPNFELYSLIIIAAAILVKVGIGVFYKIQAKRVDSPSLNGSGNDALFDAFLSTATLVGAIFAYTLHWYVEGYLGILIGLFIIRSGIELLRESFSSIIGERTSAEVIKEMVHDINSVEGVKGAYDLILNNYGHGKYIGSVHVGVDSHLTAKEVQVIERGVTALMYEKYNTIMTVGIYADCEDSPEAKNIRAKLTQILKNYKNVIQLHGFFVDLNTKLCNFDLVISFDEKEPEKVIDEIKEQIQKEFPEFRFIIQLDKDYSLS